MEVKKKVWCKKKVGNKKKSWKQNHGNKKIVIEVKKKVWSKKKVGNKKKKLEVKKAF